MKEQPKKPQSKKTYERPVLEVLGDAETITKGVGSGFGDMGGIGLQYYGPGGS